MSRNILILNGSPRPNGNTSMLVKAFQKGAERKGHAVKVFSLEHMKIANCKGCMAGGKNSASPCVQNDDMAFIYEVFAQADTLVLASPLYYWTFSAQLKCALDRLYAATEANGGKTPFKETVLLMVAGDELPAFEPVLDYYRKLTGFLEWKDIGHVFAANVLNVGDIQGHPALSDAENLGESLCERQEKKR